MSTAAGMAAAEGVTAPASRRVATAATATMAASSATATMAAAAAAMLCECRAAACQDQSQCTHRQQNAFALDIHVPLLNLTAACGRFTKTYSIRPYLYNAVQGDWCT
jgi:hypothetical protein